MIIEQILEKNNKMLKSYPFNPSLGKLNTPSELVHEMIKCIPESSFISNDTKFLDPCAGSGTYIIEVLRRLLKYKSFDIAIKQVYMCEISRPISNAFLLNILPKTKINITTDNLYITEYFNLIISEISGGLKTFNDLYYIIYSENIKNQLNEMKLNINSFIEKYEKISKLESKLFGEVFTPEKLIKEMLNCLPKEIWSNKNLKWLDPAVGIGNFPAIVVQKLMEGLKDEIPSDSDRYKWIMEEMIYMVDISTKNLFLLYKLFDENNELKLNVYRGSFLEEGFDKQMKEVWGLEGFDVVVGNPPYQSTNATGDNKLYLDFSKKSISVLLKSGNLLFVTPKNITDYILLCDKNRSYFDDFYQIDNLVIDTPSKYFNGVGSTFLYFNLKKEKYVKPTKIKCFNLIKEEIESEILLKKGQSIPNIVSDIDLSIISKIRNIKDKFNFQKMKMNNREFRIRKKQFDNGKVSKVSNNEYCYPVIDGLNKSNPFPGKVFYIKNDFSDKKPKLIINGSGYLCPSFDPNGDYFLSDNMIYIHLENESQYENLKYIIESKIVKYWLNQFRLNGFSDAKNIQIFPYIPYDKKISDSDIYSYFNLTQSEIDLIEKTIKD
jgi:16S rRNA G966 N2-methylase RsmD